MIEDLKKLEFGFKLYNKLISKYLISLTIINNNNNTQDNYKNNNITMNENNNGKNNKRRNIDNN